MLAKFFRRIFVRKGDFCEKSPNGKHSFGEWQDDGVAVIGHEAAARSWQRSCQYCGDEFIAYRNEKPSWDYVGINPAKYR